MLTDNEKIVFLSRLPAEELALKAKQDPTDSVVDSVLITRVKNLSYCLRDWIFPLPLENRKQIIQCIQQGIQQQTPDFYEQLKQVSLPAYQAQSAGLQEMYLRVLKKFSILAPVNLDDKKRQFFSFFCEHLEHNALVDRMDEQRQKQLDTQPRKATEFEKGMEIYRKNTSLFPHL